MSKGQTVQSCAQVARISNGWLVEMHNMYGSATELLYCEKAEDIGPLIVGKLVEEKMTGEAGLIKNADPTFACISTPISRSAGIALLSSSGGTTGGLLPSSGETMPYVTTNTINNRSIKI